MLLGYARVSKAGDQDTAAQVGALKAAGCARVYEDTASGGRWDRPELHHLLDHLRDGDTLVVWKLDRLSRVRRQGKPGSPALSVLSSCFPRRRILILRGNPPLRSFAQRVTHHGLQSSTFLN